MLEVVAPILRGVYLVEDRQSPPKGERSWVATRYSLKESSRLVYPYLAELCITCGYNITSVNIVNNVTCVI